SDLPLNFIKFSTEGHIEDFNIDDEETWWYTRKSLGIALWALWNCKTPEDILHKLVNAGGDTDTNASLAMMIAGLKYGYDALPDIKHKLNNRQRLDEMAEKLTEIIKKRKPQLQ
ncbi:MAG: ADP-ribosylglycohydrolase family protein, partial [Muribaculaceae bacterium]|nr:ADP-ribosylglycohydrolase family protein [Muribaculaceae bacterium]